MAGAWWTLGLGLELALGLGLGERLGLELALGLGGLIDTTAFVIQGVIVDQHHADIVLPRLHGKLQDIHAGVVLQTHGHNTGCC